MKKKIKEIQKTRLMNPWTMSKTLTKQPSYCAAQLALSCRPYRAANWYFDTTFSGSSASVYGLKIDCFNWFSINYKEMIWKLTGRTVVRQDLSVRTFWADCVPHRYTFSYIPERLNGESLVSRRQTSLPNPLSIRRHRPNDWS